jgi:hypothetical protein
MPYYQNAGQSHYLEMANKSLKNVSEFKCLGREVPNQNWFHVEIKGRLNLGTACYHSVQNFCPPVSSLNKM